MALPDSWFLTPIELDKADRSVVKHLSACPDDIQGRGIDLHITNDGLPVDMTGQRVVLVWRHKAMEGVAGSKEFEPVDTSQGHYRVEYSDAMLHPGEVFARIMIWVSDGVITSSRTFIVNVEENIITDVAALRNTDFNMFVQAVEELERFNARMGTVMDGIEDLQGRADGLIVDAEKARDEWGPFLEEARASEQERVEAEEQRRLDEEERQQRTDEAVQAADEATNAALDAAGDAEAVAQMLRDARDEGDFNGATFFPSVSGAGILSWTNDKGLPDPQPVVIKGEKGEPGQGLTSPKGVYGTIEELLEEHPEGAEDDAYVVGSDLYMWLDGEWKDMGPFRGPAGNGIEEVTVGYAVTDGDKPSPGDYRPTQPDAKAGQTLWTRIEFVTTDGQSYTAEIPVLVPGAMQAMDDGTIQEMFGGE